jgi:DNA replication and repair protein RecF
MASLLKESLQNDIILQRTSMGIHRDDLLFLLNDKPIKNFGSQGQKKSFLFALKLAQFQYLHNKMGHEPILLLDDIFEKLDQNRIEALLNIIKNYGQVILTDTHPERIREAFGSDTDINFIALT